MPHADCTHLRVAAFQRCARRWWHDASAFGTSSGRAQWQSIGSNTSCAAKGAWRAACASSRRALNATQLCLLLATAGIFLYQLLLIQLLQCIVWHRW
jgi:hypothetical protein